MIVPVGLIGQCFIDAVVEVLVVGEDNMTTNIVELLQILVASRRVGGF